MNEEPNIDNPGFDHGLQLDEMIQVREPDFYHVIMLNDDFTPMDFVIYVLQTIFHHSIEVATRMMLEVHQAGKCRVGLYPFDIANTKAEKVHMLAEQEQHPLQCIIEPDGDHSHVD